MNQPFDVHGARTGGAPDVRYGETTTYIDPLGNPEPVRRPEQPRYLLPPGVAAAAAREAAAAEVPATSSATDAIAEDAKPDAVKTEWPAGSPKMRPLFKLPFRQRGEAMKLFTKLTKLQSNLPEQKEGDEVTPERMVATYEQLAAMDDFLATCALDPDAYRNWVLDGEGSSEAVFIQFWNAFSDRAQPGEASSSSS